MKPTLSALIALFRRHPNAWLNHSVVYEAGAHRTTARIMELRQMGFVIEQDGQGESSRYRMTHDPLKPRYATVACPTCLWRGTEPEAIGGGSICPRCGTRTVDASTVEVRQVALSL
jgi:hypothetical protein